jgi:hypothetical protein
VSFLKKLQNAMKDSGSKDRGHAGSAVLSFQRVNAEPRRDEAGRIVIEVRPGKEIELTVVTDYWDAKALCGRAKQDGDEFSRNQKVSLVHSSSRKGEPTVAVLVAGEQVGEVRYADTEDAIAVLEASASQVLAADPNLLTQGFVVEVSVAVSGSWEEDEGSLVPSVDEAVIRLSNPLQMDIKPTELAAS